MKGFRKVYGEDSRREGGHRSWISGFRSPNLKTKRKAGVLAKERGEAVDDMEETRYGQRNLDRQTLSRTPLICFGLKVWHFGMSISIVYRHRKITIEIERSRLRSRSSQLSFAILHLNPVVCACRVDNIAARRYVLVLLLFTKLRAAHITKAEHAEQ